MRTEWITTASPSNMMDEYYHRLLDDWRHEDRQHSDKCAICNGIAFESICTDCRKAILTMRKMIEEKKNVSDWLSIMDKKEE